MVSPSATPHMTFVRMLNLHRIDDGQESLVKAFESAKGRDKDRCTVTKDLSIKSVGFL